MTDPTLPMKKRRRSRHVSTLLLGAAALSLAGCGEERVETQAQLFPSVEACAIEFPEAECREAFEAAARMHAQTAPRFSSMAACEAELGPEACSEAVVVEQSGSGGTFMPIMMGYMIGRALSPDYRGYGFGYRGSRYYPRPVYVDRDGFLRTGTNTLGRITGGRDAFLRSRTGTAFTTTTTRSGEVGQPTRTSRGGFGGTSRGFGGGG